MIRGLSELKINDYKAVSWKGKAVSREMYFPYWFLDKDNEIITRSLDVAKKLNNNKGEAILWKFSTNGNVTMGKYNIPTIGYAPSKMELAHTANEHVPVRDVITSTFFYSLFPHKVSSLF